MKNLVYKILSAFYPNGKERTISGTRIRLPFRYSRYYPVDYEAEHITFFKNRVKAGDTILDVGAQLGLMSKVFFDLTGASGKVFAFEPTPSTFQILCDTIRLNAMTGVIIPIQKAVSDKKGTTRFFVSDVPLDAANSLVNYERQQSTKGIDVQLTSIDEFVKDQNLSKVNFIKIDAEGAEYQVLLGARTTLNSCQPIVHLALHPEALKNFDSSLERIFELIRDHNYNILYKSKSMTLQDFKAKTELFDVELLPQTKI